MEKSGRRLEALEWVDGRGVGMLCSTVFLEEGKGQTLAGSDMRGDGRGEGVPS